MSKLRESLNDIELELDDLKHMAAMADNLTGNMFIGPNEHGMFLAQKHDRDLVEFAMRDIGARVEIAMNHLAAITDALEAEEAKGRAAA